MGDIAVQLRRGTAAQHSTFIGAPGEVTADMSKKCLVLHDGVTPGGFPTASPFAWSPDGYGFSSTAGGAANQTALTNLMAALPPGATIQMPVGSFTIAGTWTIDKPCTIRFEGCTLMQSSRSTKAIVLASSGVKILRLTLIGPQTATYDREEIGIYAAGADVSRYLTDIAITDCDISNFGCHAIETKFVKRSWIWQNYLHDCLRGGYVGYDCDRVDASHNEVVNITPGDTSSPPCAYGIAFAGQSTTPRGNRAIGNYVEKVVWMGIQGEPSSDSEFCDNVVVDCYHGMNVNSHATGLISSDTKVDNNLILNKTLGTSVGFGLGAGGLDAGNPNLRITYSNNTIVNYGNNTPYDQGAVYLRFNERMQFIDNIILGYRAGLHIQQYNTNCVFRGGYIGAIGTAGGGGGGVGGVYLSNGHNDGSILEGITIDTGAVRGIYVATADPLFRLGHVDYRGTGDLINDYSLLCAGRISEVSDSSTSGTSKTTLKTRTFKGGTLLAKGGTIKFRCGGVKTGSAGNKSIGLEWGTDTVTLVAAANNTNSWFVKGEIVNTSATTQTLVLHVFDGSTWTRIYQAGAQNTANDVTLNITGTCVSGSDAVTAKEFKTNIWPLCRD